MKLYDIDKRRQFLYDMVYYYGNNVSRRAIVGPSYMRQPRYMTPDGRGCPIGRYMMRDKSILYLRGSIKNLFLYDQKSNTDRRVSPKDYLPSNVLELGMNFLSAVSSLHDGDAYWRNDGGLSYDGQDKFFEIIENYCTDNIVDYEHFF